MSQTSVSIKVMEIALVAFLGLLFGSFVNALVWRLRKKRDFVKERSECTHCHHVLEWYDLVPVLSWLSLGGKCRYCHKKIDDSPLTEIGVSVAFAISYAWWPFGFSAAGWALLVLWLVALVFSLRYFSMILSGRYYRIRSCFHLSELVSFGLSSTMCS